VSSVADATSSQSDASPGAHPGDAEGLTGVVGDMDASVSMESSMTVDASLADLSSAAEASSDGDASPGGHPGDAEIDFQLDADEASASSLGTVGGSLGSFDAAAAFDDGAGAAVEERLDDLEDL
jgi:hypothetical protein